MKQAGGKVKVDLAKSQMEGSKVGVPGSQQRRAERVCKKQFSFEGTTGYGSA
jgi:hypothetical protein